jgi:hypothetical protein
MKKMATRTSRNRIRRWGSISTFGTMGRHKKRAPEHRMESGRQRNIDIQTQGTKHRAVIYGRLRYKSTGVTTAEPRHITHKADGTQRRQHIEMREIHTSQSHDPEGGYNPTDNIYTSAIGECFHALPKHVR